MRPYDAITMRPYDAIAMRPCDAIAMHPYDAIALSLAQSHLSCYHCAHANWPIRASPDPAHQR